MDSLSKRCPLLRDLVRWASGAIPRAARPFLRNAFSVVVPLALPAAMPVAATVAASIMLATFAPVAVAQSATTVLVAPNEPATPISLRAAIDLALAANPDYSAAVRELQAVDAQLLQAGLRPNPELVLLSEDERRRGDATTLQLNQRIELGGKRQARIAAAGRDVDAAAADVATARAQLRAQVVGAFLGVLAAQDRVRLADASAELARRSAEIAQQRIGAGRGSEDERTRARVFEASVRIERIEAGAELAGARRRLASTWGSRVPRFERADGDVDTLIAFPSLTELGGRLQDAPGLARARLEVARRDALVDLERSLREERRALAESEARYRDLEQRYQGLLSGSSDNTGAA